MATLVGRGCVYSSGFATNSSEAVDYDDDGRFTDEDEDAEPPPPVAKNFESKPPAPAEISVKNVLLNQTFLKRNDNFRRNSSFNLVEKSKNVITSRLSRFPSGKIPNLDDRQRQREFLISSGLVRSESAPSANATPNLKPIKEANELNNAEIDKNEAPDQPVYNVPQKKALTPKLTKSASFHPTIKPPPPPVNKLKKSPSSCNTSNSSIGSNSSSNNGTAKSDVNVESSQMDLDDMPWFHGFINRQNAEKKLLDFKKEGCFLLRHKSDVVPNVPYALSVLHEKVYHLEIRQKKNGCFALGDVKDGEAEFSCLQSLVCYYKRKPLQLVRRSTSEITGRTVLTVTPLK